MAFVAHVGPSFRSACFSTSSDFNLPICRRCCPSIGILKSPDVLNKQFTLAPFVLMQVMPDAATSKFEGVVSQRPA